MMHSAQTLASALLVGAFLYSSAVAGQTAGLFTPVEDGPSAVATLPEGTLRTRLVRVDHGHLSRARTIVAALPSAQGRLEVSDKRAREAVQASSASLQSGASLQLYLFDDVSVTAIVEWTEPTFSGGYSLSGSLLEDPLGSMTLVVNGDRIVGSVETGGRSYQFRTVSAGLYSISEVLTPSLSCGVDDLPELLPVP